MTRPPWRVATEPTAGRRPSDGRRWPPCGGSIGKWCRPALQASQLAADDLTGGGTERDRKVGQKIAEGTGFGIADEQLGRGEPAHRLARFDRLHREAGRRQQLAHLLLIDAMGQPPGGRA